MPTQSEYPMAQGPAQTMKGPKGPNGRGITGTAETRAVAGCGGRLTRLKEAVGIVRADLGVSIVDSLVGIVDSAVRCFFFFRERICEGPPAS